MNETRVDRSKADAATTRFASDAQTFDTSISAGCKLRAHAQNWIKAANHSGSFWYSTFVGTGNATTYHSNVTTGLTFQASSLNPAVDGSRYEGGMREMWLELFGAKDIMFIT